MRALPRLLAFALALCLARGAFAQDVLPPKLPPHPRLLLTDADLLAAEAGAKTDPLRAKLNEAIIALAERQLRSRELQHKLIGPRMLDEARDAIKQILTGAYAYRLTGDPRFLKRATHDLDTVSAFADWNPSHFLDVAELSFAVGIGYDWLYPALTPEQRSTYEDALLKHSLSFAPVAYGPNPKSDKRLFWVTAHMNWNQVCNGGLLTAALAIADDHRDLANQVIAGVRKSLPLAMEAYSPDGAYPEGPGYWEYGTLYNLILISDLKSALGTDFGISDFPNFSKTALFRMATHSPSGESFNYADGSAQLGDSAAMTWFGNRFGNPTVQASNRALLEKTLTSNKHEGEEARFFALHAIWFPEAVKGPSDSLPNALHFSGGADIALLRSKWNDPNALFVGFKAGDNKVNHSHLDLGSFVLDSDGVRWGVDMGPDSYNLPEYFGKKRFTYFRLTNFAHNTITPGTLLQDSKAVVPITHFATFPDHSFAVANLSPAYPDAADSMERGIALLDGNRVIVQDEIVRPRAGVVFHWNFFTRSAVLIAPGSKLVTLTEGDKTLTLRIVEPDDAHWNVKMAKPPTKDENPNLGTRDLSFDAAAPEEATSLRIVVAIEPTSAGWPKDRLAPVVSPLESWK